MEKRKKAISHMAFRNYVTTILESKTKKEFTEKLKKIMPEQAGDFNEGLMELGERICIPNGEPLCERCPLQKICVAKKEIKNILQNWSLTGNQIEKIGTHHHVFSHMEWDMIGYKVQVNNSNQEFIWVEKETILEKYPIPGAFVPFRKEI